MHLQVSLTLSTLNWAVIDSAKRPASLSALCSDSSMARRTAEATEIRP